MAAAHWSDRYLGLPYEDRAFDCAALAERVAREVFHREVCLPSERRAGAFGRSAQIAAEAERFAEPAGEPADGDPVLLVTGGRLQHVGVLCLIQREAWVLLNQETAGVWRCRVRDLARFGMRIEGYYRWK